MPIPKTYMYAGTAILVEMSCAEVVVLSKLHASAAARTLKRINKAWPPRADLTHLWYATSSNAVYYFDFSYMALYAFIGGLTCVFRWHAIRLAASLRSNILLPARRRISLACPIHGPSDVCSSRHSPGFHSSTETA